MEEPFRRNLNALQPASHPYLSPILRGLDLPHQPLPGQEDGPESHGAEVCQQDLGPVWSQDNIVNSTLTCKERLGTESCGSYFDEFGLILQVMQNRLLQMLCLVAMEKPVSTDSKEGQRVEMYLRGVGEQRCPGPCRGNLTEDEATEGYLDLRAELPFILLRCKALHTCKTEPWLQFHDAADSSQQRARAVSCRPVGSARACTATGGPGSPAGSSDPRIQSRT
uniref:glucose-6-phosphate dehydrogenase (NADP(+)) n=1 Tax=Myotis myotis TaxID=51298 RepID=A0A7J7XHH7_MYOMY|nr:hypothetical protein mMyoMyo1_011709 [Myotis myotis]